MNVRELVFRGEDKAVLYACGKCGRISSPQIYMAREAVRHDAARRAAEECCAPRHCTCGVELDAGWTLCAKCRELDRLRKAKVIPAESYDGPVYSDAEGDWGDGYSSNLGALMEYCFGYDVPVPAYAYPCTATPLRLDADRMLEDALADMHDGAEDQVEAVDELHDFIAQWNAKQHCVSYFADYSRVIVLDPERFAALGEMAGDPGHVEPDDWKMESAS